MDKVKGLELWDSVQESDPAAVKEVNFGRKFNAIDAYHQIMDATRKWGPYGQDWGFESEELEFLTDARLCVFRGVFRHPTGKFPVTTSIEYIGNSGKSKDKVDAEFAKKIETDAITKALSRLGFNADVFLGMFDDNRYVASLNEKKNALRQDMAQPILEELLPAADSGNAERVKEIWGNLQQDEKEGVWPLISSRQRAAIKELLK